MIKKSVQFALDKKGRKILVINQILFYGRRNCRGMKLRNI